MSAPKWKLPPGYFVSREGKVYSNGSNWRGYGLRELKQAHNRNGYAYVRAVTASHCRRKFYVHKLVCYYFIGPKPSSKHQVRHLNGNRTDNRVGNLAWGTAKENAADRAAHGNTRNQWTKHIPTPYSRAALRKARGES